jgi:hypothetical protein
MAKRAQLRHRAILPLKIVAEGNVLVGHTLDISAVGARVIVLSELATDSMIRIEYKHRRIAARVAWCRPAKGRKYEYEAGLMMQTEHPDFWGVVLSKRDIDRHPNFASEAAPDVVSMVQPKRVYGD